MDIGSNIRYYRMQMGITQGELAEMLCVSHQTVSKWERQLVYPDITVLPKLATAFHTSIDNLLNFNISEAQKYIAEIKEKLHKYNETGNISAQKQLLEAAIQKYPQEPFFIERLLNVCIPLAHTEKLSETDFLRMKAIGDHYVGKSDDKAYSDSILRALALLCASFERYSNEAMVYYQRIPSLRNIKSNIAHFLLQPEEYACIAPKIIADHIYYASLMCRNLALQAKSEDEKAEKFLASNQIIENFFLDENHGYFSTILTKNHYDLSLLFLNTDEERFFIHAEKCLLEAMHYLSFLNGNYRTILGEIEYDKSIYYDKNNYFEKYKQKYSENIKNTKMSVQNGLIRILSKF
ncbi:MAG: helix-turn-helix transcriptional regulator [Clostridia bacterium]|nr:helix-turn-helix transcriptional regulator [Clostridia bacterium]